MKCLHNLLLPLLVLCWPASPNPHWAAAVSSGMTSIEEVSTGHEADSDLIMLFWRHAGLILSQPERSPRSSPVAEFEGRLRGKSNEDILWETLGPAVNMPTAPDEIKQFHASVLAGEVFAQERKVREALTILLPEWEYVRAVNRNASLNVDKELVHAAYEHWFLEEYSELCSGIEDMTDWQEQDKARAVFHHICQAYADHGLYFTIVSPRRSWTDIVAHLDRYVELTAGKSESVLRDDYKTFVPAAVSEYREYLQGQLDGISKTVYRLDRIEDRFARLYEHSRERATMTSKEAIDRFGKAFQTFLDGSTERNSLYSSLLSGELEEDDAPVVAYQSGELLEREMDSLELKLLGLFHPRLGQRDEFREALRVLRAGCINYAKRCRIAPRRLKTLVAKYERLDRRIRDIELANEGKPAAGDETNILYIKVKDPEPRRLCNPTKRLLARLRHPIQMELYYAKGATASLPAIRAFDDYYESVHELLQQYVAVSRGMIDLRVINPAPYSAAEEAAILGGLKKYPISEEKNFFLGLVVRTKYKVEKVIPFFSPDRRDLLEYDITSLIDSAMISRKRRIGIMSPLQVMGDDVSGYMAEMMRRQEQQPRQPWTFVEQLRKEYEVEAISTDAAEIDDIDLLLVIHPKDLPERTLFAIDQFLLKGGRAVVCVDPYCFSDRPDPNEDIRNAAKRPHNSQLNGLLKTWGLEMPADTFAGDRNLASMASIRAKEKPQKIIGYLNLTPEKGCFAADNIITWDLSQVRVLFSGVLREISHFYEVEESQTPLKRIPLIMTSSTGGTLLIGNQHEMMFMDPPSLMQKFVDGSGPLAMGYLITGRFRSSFPDDIPIDAEVAADKSSAEQASTKKEKTRKFLRGLSRARRDGAVIVFADVDFISDALAYQNSFFGKIAVGDNADLLLKAVSSLLGSDELVEMASRRIDRQPRKLVDEIRHTIDETFEREQDSDEIAAILKQVESLEEELKNLVNSAKEGEIKTEIVGSSVVSKKAELEKKILQAQIPLRRLKQERHIRLEQLKEVEERLRGFNIPGSLADELDLDDLQSLVVGTGPDSVRLRRQGGGMVVVVKDKSANALVDGGDSSVGPVPVSECEFVPGPLIQGLNTSEVGYITVGSNYDSVILRRVENRFVVGNKGDYPARMSAVNELISSCLEMRVTDRITDSADIQRVQRAMQENQQIIVQFLNPDKTLLVGCVIGKLNQQGHAHCVRLLPNDEVYTAEEVPSIENDVLHYIDCNLLSVRGEDIESVTIASDREEYTIVPEQDGAYTVQDGKDGGKKAGNLETERVFQILCALRFDHVTKSDEMAVELDFAHKYVCRMKDSTEYVCRISQMNGNFYLTIDSEFTDETPVKKGPEVEPLEILKEKESRLLAKDHAMKFSQKHKGWIYKIPRESGARMVARLGALVE